VPSVQRNTHYNVAAKNAFFIGKIASYMENLWRLSQIKSLFITEAGAYCTATNEHS
jgi:hypothetical protein